MGRTFLVAMVEDSDYAVVIGAVDPALRFALIVNRDAAADYADGQRALGLTLDAGADMLGRFGGWTAPPRRPNLQRAQDILNKRWTFAEDGMLAILEEVGLTPPSPAAEGFEGAVSLLNGKTRFEGVRIDWKTSRFVPGFGEGFFGIWDREKPGPAVARFPVDDYLSAISEAERLEMENLTKGPPD